MLLVPDEKIMKLSLVVVVALIGICLSAPALELANLEDSAEETEQVDIETPNDINEETNDPSRDNHIAANVSLINKRGRPNERLNDRRVSE